MSVSVQQFPFVEMDPAVGDASRMAFLPMALTLGQQSAAVEGLIDTGAAISVLPHAIGLKLGAVWDQQTVPLQLTGNLAAFEARALLVAGIVGRFAPVPLVFAWVRSDQIPVLFGHVNFLAEFDVCFFRSKWVFEIRPK